jgi:4-hydroxybutyrate CoA-transferase
MYKKWREMYKSKLVTADEAAAMIRDGEVISSAFGNGQPIGLYEALRKRVMAGKLYKPTILAASMVQDLPLMDPEIEDRIEFDSFFVKSERSRIKEGYFTHTPNKFSDLEKISSRGLRSVQVSVLRVSPMDSHGFFSTGSMWTLAGIWRDRIRTEDC